MFRLFLDDVRKPSDVNWIKDITYVDDEWVIAHDYNEFVDTIVARGNPDVISFDHDLAPEHYRSSMYNPDMHYNKYYTDGTFTVKTGYECAQWYVNFLRETNQDAAVCYIHTLNPVGGINIYRALTEKD